MVESSNLDRPSRRTCSNGVFLGTYPLVKGGEELDVRLEVLSCLLEGFVV